MRGRPSTLRASSTTTTTTTTTAFSQLFVQGTTKSINNLRMRIHGVTVRKSLAARLVDRGVRIAAIRKGPWVRDKGRSNRYGRRMVRNPSVVNTLAGVLDDLHSRSTLWNTHAHIPTFPVNPDNMRPHSFSLPSSFGALNAPFLRSGKSRVDPCIPRIGHRAFLALRHCEYLLSAMMTFIAPGPPSGANTGPMNTPALPDWAHPCVSTASCVRGTLSLTLTT